METAHAMGGSSSLPQGKPGLAPPGISGVNGANVERLLVEFAVERTEDLGYGVQAKYLLYNEKRIKYKAVVKNGKVVAIVTRRYKIVPNEYIAAILEKTALPARAEATETRFIWRAQLDENFGITVVNSIDGTLALTVSLLAYGVPVKKQILEKMNMPYVYRKHFSRLNEADILLSAIEHLKNFAAQFGKELTQYLSIQVDDVVRKAFADSRLPRKYLSESLQDRSATLAQVVSHISRRIWAADLNPFVRNMYLNELADVVWEIVLAKNP